MKRFLKFAFSFMSLAVCVFPDIFAQDRRFLLLPAEFKDLSLQASVSSIRELSDRAAEYFNAQLPFSCSIEVAPAFKLSKDLSYYGSNNSAQKDALFCEAILEICTGINADIDFSRFDGILVFAAGPSEADGASQEHIWPAHSYLGRNSFHKDGKLIDEYAVCCEKGPDGVSLAGIGDICHELGHLLGLVDLYDVRGGEAIGLGGSLSPMDRGNRLNGGYSPPLLSAVDLDELDAAAPQALAPGHYSLLPRTAGGSILKVESAVKGEYFLLECRRPVGRDAFISHNGLAAYHIDRSYREALWSQYYGRILTARQRWELNEVNGNPEHECAYLADAEKLQFWDGSSSPLSITDIRDSQDGSVEFDVIEVVRIREIRPLQNAVMLSVESDIPSSQIADVQLWCRPAEGGADEISTRPGSLSFIVSGLAPMTDYLLGISIRKTSGELFTRVLTFTTLSFRAGSHPFIFLDGKGRNTDGSFAPQSSIPLVLFNSEGSSSVRWYFNGKEIFPGRDGRFPLPSSGILRAEMTLPGGELQFIEKKINVR